MFCNAQSPNIMKKPLIFHALLIVVLFQIHAQNPGGVAGANLWLKANDGPSSTTNNTPITNWENKATGGFPNPSQATVANQPLYIDAVPDTNFNASIRFDGGNDWMGANTTTFPTTNYSVYAVYKSTDASGALFTVTQPVSPSAGNHDRQFGFTNPGRFSNRIWNNETISSTNTYNNGTSHIFSNHVSNNTTNNALNGQENKVNGVQVALGTKNASNFNWAIGFVLGGHTAWGYLNADVQEFIIIGDLNVTQRQQVESYLAIKYGVTLDQSIVSTNDGTGDYVLSDGTVVYDAHNGTEINTFNNDIFGIGKDDDSGLEQRISKSVNNNTILTVSTDTNFTAENTTHTNVSADLSFITFANNSGVALAEQISELPNGHIANTGINREWQVQRTNFNQDIHLKFEGYDANWHLYKKAADGDFSTGTIIDLGALNANGEISIAYTGVAATDLLDGDYFTLASLVANPGGVVNSSLWYKANKNEFTLTDGVEVEQWVNHGSGGVANSFGTPLFETDADEVINFNPIVRFNDLNDAYNISGTTPTVLNASVFLVARSRNTLGSDVALGGGKNIITLHNGTNNLGTQNPGGSGFVDSGYDISNNSINLIDVHLPNVSGGSYNFTVNGLGLASNTTTFSGNISVLGNQSVINRPYGDIAEVVVYDNQILNSEKQKVRSYLSLKYGITLDPTDNDATITEGDYILSDGTTKVWDVVANTSFHNDVAGIGRDDASGLHQKQSMSINSDALVAIGLGTVATTNNANANTFTANKDFLVWGNNGTSALGADASCVNALQLNRTWKIVETGSVGTVEFTINKPQIDAALNLTNDRTLIIADDEALTTNVQYINLTTATTKTVNGVVHYSVNHDFNGTKYFTIGQLRDKVAWDGVSAWSGGSGTAGAPDTTDTIKVLEINSGTKADLNANANVECVCIKSGGRLMINDNVYLNITNELILDGDIRLLGNGQLIQSHTNTETKVSGNGTLYQELQSNYTVAGAQYKTSYLSASVHNAGTSNANRTYTFAGVFKDGTTTALSDNSTHQALSFTGAYDGSISPTTVTISRYWLATFIDGTNTFNYPYGENTALAVGAGMSLKTMAADFVLEGTPNDGSFNIPVSDGVFYLVGNPYPSDIDADTFIDDNSAVTTNTLYFYNGEADNSTHVQSQYAGMYTTINQSGTVPANTSSSIASGQGFFVEANANGTLTFNNQQRAYSTIDLVGRTAENTVSSIHLGFEFEVEDRLFHRQVLMAFNGQTSNFEEGYDAEMWDQQPTDLHLKVNDRPDTAYVITGQASLTSTTEVPLMINLDEARSVTFTLDQVTNINMPIYLKDNLTFSFYDLQDGNVSLELPAGSFNDRFSIVFNVETLSTTNPSLEENASIFTTQDRLVVELPQQIIPNKVILYNVMGQEISVWDQLSEMPQNHNNQYKFNIEVLSKGVYIAKVDTDNGIVSKKVIIK